MTQKKLPQLNRVIYILGGILIVAAAIQVIYSGCQYLRDYLRKEEVD